MTAFGWQTAPPQFNEVVLATNSVCPHSQEASHRDIGLQKFRPVQHGAQLFHLRPAAGGTGVVHAASAPRILSAPTVSNTYKLIGSIN